MYDVRHSRYMSVGRCSSHVCCVAQRACLRTVVGDYIPRAKSDDIELNQMKADKSQDTL